MSRFACIAAICMLSGSAFDAVRAESRPPLRLNYEVRLGGFAAATIAIEATVGEAAYRISSQIESRGLVGVLTGFRSAASSAGTLQEARLHPIEHSADNDWLGDSRWVRIRYSAEAAPEFEAFPPPEDDDRDPVPRERTQGTLDPLSAGLQAALAAGAGGGCEGKLEIFDGRRRYALDFSDRRREGGMLRCRVGLERMVGHSHDPWLPMVRPIETAELWIAAPREGAPPLPVRLEAETGLGMAIVQLTSLDQAAR